MLKTHGGRLSWILLRGTYVCKEAPAGIGGAAPGRCPSPKLQCLSRTSGASTAAAYDGFAASSEQGGRVRWNCCRQYAEQSKDCFGLACACVFVPAFNSATPGQDKRVLPASFRSATSISHLNYKNVPRFPLHATATQAVCCSIRRSQPVVLLPAKAPRAGER